ncbi:hypothetical protein [Lacinutrix undariae]
MKLKVTVLLLMFSITFFAQEVKIPTDTHFYNPIINSYSLDILEPSALNNANQIQEAINKVSSEGGGILTIKASGNNNTYIINDEVEVKSGVHIRVKPGVIFKSESAKAIKLFSVGKSKKNKGRILNISINSTDNKTPFIFDFTNRISGEDRNGGTIAVALGGVQNFKIANFKVFDNFTRFSAITMNLQQFSKDKFLFPKNGIVENITSVNAHYGYGVVQCQASENVLFKKLEGVGGATLRLETGAVHNAYLKDKSIGIRNAYAENIVCKNGQAAVTLSPHTIKNGKVFIDNVTAISCEAGLIIASGFLSAKKGQRDKKGNAINGHAYGTFDTASIISNVLVKYGINAQLRGSRRSFVPCNQRILVHKKMNKDEESFKGPTIAGMVYFAKGGTNTEKGFYTVKTPNFIMQDFPKENKVYIVNNKDFVEGCTINWSSKSGHKKNHDEIRRIKY